jgi:hypothetical protein
MEAEMTDATPLRDSQACLRCGSTLQSMGIEEFRTGGTSGGWKLLFGEWAELGEQMLKLEVRACSSCGQVELRVPRNL